MQGEPYATPVIVGDDGVTRQKDIVHDIKQMPDDTAIVDVLYAGSKKGSKDDTKAEHMTMKKVDVRRLGSNPAPPSPCMLWMVQSRSSSGDGGHTFFA